MRAGLQRVHRHRWRRRRRRPCERSARHHVDLRHAVGGDARLRMQPGAARHLPARQHRHPAACGLALPLFRRRRLPSQGDHRPRLLRQEAAARHVLARPHPSHLELRDQGVRAGQAPRGRAALRQPAPEWPPRAAWLQRQAAPVQHPDGRRAPDRRLRRQVVPRVPLLARRPVLCRGDRPVHPPVQLVHIRADIVAEGALRARQEHLLEGGRLGHGVRRL
mmetsp:Transcript_12881/g.37821  ORF Transcript_12881/g.37821 Transcript_12881/m.37821 type:complete len:220 (-) Transcript_12881:270-929(-)